MPRVHYTQAVRGGEEAMEALERALYSSLDLRPTKIPLSVSAAYILVEKDGHRPVSYVAGRSASRRSKFGKR
jgi:hypothetical protein